MLWHMFVMVCIDYESVQVSGAVAVPARMTWLEIAHDFRHLVEGATYAGVWEASHEAGAIAKFMAMVGEDGKMPDDLGGVAWCNPQQVWLDKVNDTLASLWKANMAAGKAEEDAYEAALRENAAIHGRTGAEMGLCELREWA